MIADQPVQASSSPLLAQVLSHANRRRSRQFAAVAAALSLLTFVWLWTSATPDVFVGERYPSAEGSSQFGLSMVSPKHLIPPKIWQIMLPHKAYAEAAAINPEQLQDTPSWLALNRDYTYTLVGHRGSKEFMQRNFAKESRLMEAYNNLRNVGMKSDLLRYLILSVEGGVYTDTDTVGLKPIDAWVPVELRDKVRLIVGIEFDRRDGVEWADISHWVQFCQWTIAAAPGHPVFRRMVNRILDSLDLLSLKYDKPVSEISPTSFEVMNSTGPAAWTDAVFEELQRFDPSLNTTEDLSFMTEPKLYGDILVLTIDGFGMGQQHSNSTNDGSVPDAALVKHLFRGSWRDST
ncbi:Initiation-specific alpha-1,6-mannosyltransferase [Paramyrothecium foliicola]|nr:Initiation-specific alpha-1,6-mannosyltransferase [Paramyrothecium foliicola]